MDRALEKEISKIGIPSSLGCILLRTQCEGVEILAPETFQCCYEIGAMP